MSKRRISAACKVCIKHKAACVGQVCPNHSKAWKSSNAFPARTSDQGKDKVFGCMRQGHRSGMCDRHGCQFIHQSGVFDGKGQQHDTSHCAYPTKEMVAASKRHGE
jgi:hypothetical protein